MTDEQSKAPTESGQAPPHDQQSQDQPTNQQPEDRPASQPPEDQPAAQESGGSAEQRAEEYLRMAQRAQADLINYRRRVDQERDELRTAARIDAASAILPVLDDFERAISAIPSDEREKGWVQGILLIERNLRAVVERAGLERIDAKGQPFDPYAHEAIMADEHSEQEENTVTQVIRPGYKVGARIVRPAQVVVARGKTA
jgi:molecular chaperone GrpE